MGDSDDCSGLSGTKYYKPEIISEKPLPIPNPGSTGSLPDGTKDGFIRTSLEEDVVIQRISHDLYEHASSGLRELYANEARACRHAMKHHGADSRIEITLDPVNRSLAIEGIDSMGMSWETFTDVYTVLGRSTNFEGTENGQFGFGRAAYLCLSEIMIMDVHSRETGKKYSVLGKNGMGFQTGLPEPDMDHFGTRISLTLYEKIDMVHLCDMIKFLSRLSGVPTILNLRSRVSAEYANTYEEGTHSYLPETISGMAGRCAEDEPLFNSCNGNQSLGSYVFEFGDDDFDAACVFRIIRTKNGKIETPHYNFAAQTFLARIPIEYGYGGFLKYHCARMFVNILDERKYPPTPDRERLSDGSSKRITAGIDAAFKKCFKEQFCVGTLEEYLSHPKRTLMTCIDENLWSESDQQMQEILAVARHQVRNSRGGRTRLGLCSGSRFLAAEKMEKSKVDAVRCHDPGIEVVRPDDPSVWMDRFTGLGIETLDGYIKRHGLAVKRMAPPAVTEVPVHFHRERAGEKGVVLSERRGVADVGRMTVVVNNGRMPVMRKILGRWDTGYCLTKPSSALSGSCIREDDLIRTAEGSAYVTSEGPMLPAHMPAAGKDIVLVLHNWPRLAELVKSDKKLLVIETGDRLFELEACLSARRIPYKISTAWYDRTGKSADKYCDIKDVMSNNMKEHSGECLSYVTSRHKMLYLHGELGIRDKTISRMFWLLANRNADTENVEKMLALALDADARLGNDK